MTVLPSDRIRKDGLYLQLSNTQKDGYSFGDTHYLRGIMLNQQGSFFDLRNGFDASIEDNSYGGLKSLLNSYIKESMDKSIQTRFAISNNIKSLVAVSALDDIEYSIICTLYDNSILFVECFTKELKSNSIINDITFSCNFISFHEIKSLSSDEILKKFISTQKKPFWKKLF